MGMPAALAADVMNEVEAVSSLNVGEIKNVTSHLDTQCTDVPTLIQLSTDVVERSGRGAKAAAYEENILDKPIPCRRLRNIDKKTSNETAAKEIAHSLKEFKHDLVHSVVNVLGISTAVQLFHETAKIQRSGGEMTADGERRKYPGGVFFTLVKKRASDEERALIFKKEKLRQSRNKAKKRMKAATNSTEGKNMSNGLKVQPNEDENMEVDQPTAAVAVTAVEEESVTTSNEALLDNFELTNDIDFGIEFT